ncbi:MAG: sigma-54 dependent transcriptional regulator [Gemmatimonadota bacterium]
MVKTAASHLLLVDDDQAAVSLLAEVLEREHYEVVTATSVQEALKHLGEEGPFDLILTDLRMPGASGLDLLRVARDRFPATIVIVLTAFGDASAAAEAIRAGAYDFISKPYDLPELRLMISRSLERRSFVTPPTKDAVPLTGNRFPEGAELIGRSPAIISVMKTVARTAPSQASVLITGETGTGKELVARTVHRFSDRARAKFVGVSCSALAEGLLESELFGHVRGAFTGAVSARPGLFREADRGTLFLDEIGDISVALQARLLRVLQEREVTPVGAETPVSVDARVIAATHRDLGALVGQGKFREDLYYRLNVVTIDLPPLRERRQDIPLLIDHFLGTLAERHGRGLVALDRDAQALLLAYDWPGNIRQLLNVLERALVLAAQDVIGVEHLAGEVRGLSESASLPTPAPTTAPMVPLAQVERQHVLGVLASCGGNRERAAQVLRISRRTLTRMLQRWGLSSGAASVRHQVPPV